MRKVVKKKSRREEEMSEFLLPTLFSTLLLFYFSTPPHMQPIIRLSVSEASKLFGVSQRTIRRAITAQEITYVVVQGRYKINFESLLRWSQLTTTIRNKRDKQGIGQYVDQWKVKNKLFSPNPNAVHDV